MTCTYTWWRRLRLPAGKRQEAARLLATGQPPREALNAANALVRSCPDTTPSPSTC
jgi:hypothetical protein